MRGRKPKPTHLKLVTGTAKRRLGSVESKLTPLLPDPPRELSADAREEWQRVAPRLHVAGILTALDRAVLAAYCQAFGRWLQAERVLAEMARGNAAMSGLLIKTISGNAIHNPLLGISNKAMSDMVRYAAELGMTPSGRSRLNYHDPQHDPVEDQFFTS